MYRQGDVLIERVGEINTLKPTNDNLLVRGEGRNHGHFISGEGVDIFLAPEEEQNSNDAIITHYLSVREESTLEHLYIDSSMWTTEHDPIVIPPGTYRVIRQREYNPYAKAIRAVKD